MVSDSALKAGNRSRRQAIAWVLVIAWACAIFAMSAKTAAEFSSGTGIVAIVKRWLAVVLSDFAGHPVDPSPIGHFTEYLVFGALLVNALRYHVNARKAVAGAIAIAALYAVSDEFHQLFVPGRACDPLDWLVDMSAVCLAALVGWLVLRHKQAGDSGG